MQYDMALLSCMSYALALSCASCVGRMGLAYQLGGTRGVRSGVSITRIRCAVPMRGVGPVQEGEEAKV
jgi:hypothetical protein